MAPRNPICIEVQHAATINRPTPPAANAAAHATVPARCRTASDASASTLACCRRSPRRALAYARTRARRESQVEIHTARRAQASESSGKRKRQAEAPRTGPGPCAGRPGRKTAKRTAHTAARAGRSGGDDPARDRGHAREACSAADSGCAGPLTANSAAIRTGSRLKRASSVAGERRHPAVGQLRDHDHPLNLTRFGQAARRRPCPAKAATAASTTFSSWSTVPPLAPTAPMTASPRFTGMPPAKMTTRS